MKTKTKTPPAKQARLPKGRAMFCNANELEGEYTFDVSKSIDPSHDRMWTLPVAVLPCPTQKAARAVVKAAPFLFLSREDQVKELSWRIYSSNFGVSETERKHHDVFPEWVDVVTDAVLAHIYQDKHS